MLSVGTVNKRLAGSTMNWRWIVLGGLLSTLVWGTLYAPIHPLVEVHDATGKPVLPLTPFAHASFTMRALVVANGFVQGIAMIWLYAAIRPRFGAGARTALVAGFSIWLLRSWGDVTWAAFSATRLSLLVLPLLANLAIVLLAALAGARVYRE